MSKFLYPIYKLNIESYKKWWLYHKKAGGSGILSEILQGFSFNLANTLNRKFKLFEIEGNSVQDGSPSPNNEVPILSAGDNGSINQKITNSDGTKEQDYSIPIQQPMRSIGDIRDCFVNVNGNWYERHYILRKIFDGTENWVYSYNNFVLARQSVNTHLANSECLSNNYIYSSTALSGDYGIRTGNADFIQIRDTNYDNVTDFKAMLSEKYANGTPIYVDYILAEPQDLPCTPEQIEALENMPSTYKNFTIIQSQDETPAYLKIQYYKEG